MGYWMLPIVFFPSDLRCHSNEISDKIGYNSACVRDICKIFAPIERYSGMGYWMLPIALLPTYTHCHGNEIWDKIAYNAACLSDVCEIFASIRRGVTGMRH